MGAQKNNSVTFDDSVRNGGVVALVSDLEAGKGGAVQFPLAHVGPKQDSITQSHVGKGETPLKL